MKKIVCFLLCTVCLFIFFGCNAQTTTKPEYALIRIHIRANSNQSDDQQVKLKVKESVTALLSTALDGVTDFDEAYGLIKENLNNVETSANETLKENGFSYKSSARLTQEFFPTRAYEEIVIESGYYDALIVSLGDGKGDNWWCVIYPPLCFVGKDNGGGFKYKSLIVSLWKKFTS